MKMLVLVVAVAATVNLAGCDPSEDVAEAVCEDKVVSAECTQDPRCSWIVPHDVNEKSYCEARD